MRVVAEVDVELGLTRVVWIGVAQEVGRALDRQAVEGQIEGGIAQGLGLALMEEIQTSGGLITNASFTDYLIPTALDMPRVETVIIEELRTPTRPTGSRGSASRRRSSRPRRSSRRSATRPAASSAAPRSRPTRSSVSSLAAQDGTPSSIARRAGGSCRTTTATDETTIAAPTRIRVVSVSLRKRTPSRIATTGLT